MRRALDAFFNVSSCGLILLNREGETVRRNEKGSSLLQAIESETSDVNLPAYLKIIKANELLNAIDQCLAEYHSFQEISVFIPALFNDFTFNGETLEHEGELCCLISLAERNDLERKQLLDQIDSQQSFIEKMNDTVPGILYVFDLVQQKNVYSNTAVVSILGYSMAEVKEMGDDLMPRLLHPEDAIRIGRHLANFPNLADGETTDLEYRMMHKDGEYRWLKSRESVFARNHKNEITQIVGTAIDITEQKKAEENKARLLIEARLLNEKLSRAQQELRKDKQHLNRSEAYLRAVLNSGDYGIFATDKEWNVLFFNDFHAKYHELTFGKKPAIGDNMREALFSINDNVKHKVYSRVLNGEIISFEARIENAGGEGHHWGAFTYSPIVMNREIVGVVFLAKDITKRKLNELKLQRREKQLSSLVNSHRNYLIQIDMEGNYTFANKPFLDAFGLTEDEIIGQSCMPTIIPEDHAKTHEVVEECINNPGKIYSLSIRKPTSKGEIKHTNWEFVAIPDESGKSYDIQCIGQDVTEQRLAEKSRNEILSRVSDGFFSVDNEWRMIYANAAALKTWQLKPENVYGKTIEEMFPEAWKSGFFAVFREAMEKQHPMVSEEYYPLYNRWYSATCYPSESGMSVYFQDITERKLAEIETAEYAEQLNTILESITDAFFTVDKEWYLTRVNTEFLELVGSSRKQLLGQKLWAVFPQRENGPMASRLKASMENHETSVFQQYFAPKDVWLDVRVYASKDGLSVYLKDITEEKKKEKKLLEVSERLFIATQAAQIGIFEYNISEDRLEWDDTMYRLHGFGKYDAQNIQSISQWNALLHPDNACKTGVSQFWYNALQQNTNRSNYESEYKILTPGKQVRHLRSFVDIIRNSEGKADRVVGVNYDITAIRKAEERVLSFTNRLSVATKVANIGVWEYDVIKNKIFWNENMYAIYEIPVGEEITFQSYQEFIHPDSKAISEPDRGKYSKKLSEKEAELVEYKIITRKASVKHIRSFARALKNGNGELNRVIGVNYDITDIREAEQELVTNNNELRKINAELDQFVYSTSHNLRAPLTSVMGVLEVLRDVEEEEKEYYIDMVEKSIAKLDDTIHEIIDYSRNNRQQIVTERIDFEELVNETLDSLSYLEHAQQINIAARYNLEEPFFSDPTRLKVILSNLISNAIKYTDLQKEHREVKIFVNTKHSSLSLVIEDNGIGIEADQLDKIFDMFYRGTIESSGSGLGLYIVKEAIAKLGGEIQVSSTFRKGSRFSVKMPNRVQVNSENETTI